MLFHFLLFCLKPTANFLIRKGWSCPRTACPSFSALISNVLLVLSSRLSLWIKVETFLLSWGEKNGSNATISTKTQCISICHLCHQYTNANSKPAQPQSLLHMWHLSPPWSLFWPRLLCWVSSDPTFGPYLSSLALLLPAPTLTAVALYGPVTCTSPLGPSVAGQESAGPHAETDPSLLWPCSSCCPHCVLVFWIKGLAVGSVLGYPTISAQFSWACPWKSEPWRQSQLSTMAGIKPPLDTHLYKMPKSYYDGTPAT